ncbi:MAG: TraR/DksA family transcriptional regulator [Planctomycetota bacterium]|nr:TraR/DksA family transcriptional regulator [Planctomycetota bacterium]
MLKAAELKSFRMILESLRARLRGDVTTMADAALRNSGTTASGDLSRMPIHMADIGSDAYEQEFTLSLMANEEETLELVEQALKRIKARKFGVCEECGGAIAKKRLEAIPFAAHCIRCAEKLETGGQFRPRQPR